MKRRIEQLLNGIFEYEAPEMLIFESGIHAVVRKGDNYRGSFTVESSAQRKMKGFIYSTSPRVGYEPTNFAAITEKVVYEVDTNGMDEGEVLAGEFTICSDLGEYKIPYRIEIAQSVIKTSTDVIENLDAFIQLAQQDFQKAYLLFLSSGFKKMLAQEAHQWISLYEGLMVPGVSYSSLEEFLIGIQAKKAIHISLEKESAAFGKIYQPQKESVTITKDTWGFLRFTISTDAEFLSIQRPVVTTDEFIGSSYNLEYLIDAPKLHAGRNFGRIIINNAARTLSYEVTIDKSEQGEQQGMLLKQHRQIERLMKQYINFRLKKISINAWIGDSQEALEEYHQAGGTHPMLELYHAHLFFAGDREEAACMILESLEQQKDRLDKPELWGYYFYLTTFYNKDREYIDYVEEKVTELFMQNPENWKLQWILLYLKEHLISHPTEKLDAIRRQYIYGCRSRIMYLEAAHVLTKFPLLIKKLEGFELQVLKFMCHELLLTDEIIMQTAELAGRHKEYSKELYDILTTCYEDKPSDGLLSAICGLLIKGNKEGNEYFTWFSKAVEADIRITGLYEYYVGSMESNMEKILPRIVKMYFSYNNTLNYKKKALVYANVIQNRDKDSQTFESYRPAIEKFMVDQLMEGHINKNLALIYRTFLSRTVLNKKMAESLVKILFTYEINCECKDVKAVVVQHRQLKKEQRVVLFGQKALIQLYTDDYQIFQEDESGMRYGVSMPHTLCRLLDSRELLGFCQELAPKSPELILNLCGQTRGRQVISEANIEHFCYLLEISEVKESYKRQIRQEILDYYYEHQNAPTLYEYLHRMDYEEFIETDKKKLIELLTAEGMCHEAFLLVAQYGPEHVGLISLVRMCSRNILNTEYEANEMLIYICHYCFTHGKYDETVLSYMVKYYDGPIEEMKKLWTAGRQFELDTFDLEEKLLMVLLFMRRGAEDTEDIFDTYRRKLGKDKILTAYAVYRAYDYFVKEVPVKEPVFSYIEREYEKGNKVQDVCLLALLLWYSRQPSMMVNQEEYAQKLLEKYCSNGMKFAFYKNFGTALIRPFQLQDKSFVEYRANPKAAVTVFWHLEKMNGEKTKETAEQMNHVFEGVFEKEVTLFYGEKLVYGIVEEYAGVKKEVQNGELEWTSKNSTADNTGYDLLNRLAKELEKGNDKAARAVIKTYLEQECLAEHLFTLK